jgi:adenylate cyclase
LEGRQEVKLASQRKKLTVFFSDIAGFTETTDGMESEDITQLLQYLTEMSRGALWHSATIDKHVGDAMMIFFGDPETRGVREDALACVKIAIATQKRMQELCRVDIHTGYCNLLKSNAHSFSSLYLGQPRGIANFALVSDRLSS